MTKLNDLTGRKFGRLTVLSRAENKKRRATWLCVCDCGKEKTVVGSNLIQGSTTSCGCLRAEVARRSFNKTFKSHGHTCGQFKAEYKIWNAMVSRCKNASDRSYARYGGRGITIDPRWEKDFLAFVSDIGPRPSPEYSIERKDNDGPYAPSNCKWATRAEQARNKRNTRFLNIGGRVMTLTEAARISPVTIGAIHARIAKHGWSDERAVLTPSKR